jgi:riboflavin-specific deaminase-like protein
VTSWKRLTPGYGRRSNRSPVTISYQSLTAGSPGDGHPLALSSPPSLFRTHALRARHDGLLVGIGTILADDPQLTVRHAAGPNPQPVVLDTDLRTPRSARLFAHPRPPWFMAGRPVAAARRAPLAGLGAKVFEVDRGAEDDVDLRSALALLVQHGLRSVLVEGGARVLRSFLAARLVDWIVVTLAPVFVAGKPALAPGQGSLPEVRFLGWEPSGPDLILWGELA